MANSIVAASIFAGATMIATTLYARYGNSWSGPIFKGLISFFIVLSIFMCIRILLALPLARERLTTENLESRLLGWLHKFCLTVKNNPLAAAHFCVQVSTDSDKHIFIGRSIGDWSDYLEFWAFLRPANDEEKIAIESLTQDQANWIMVNLKLELAKARIGYAGFGSLASGYRIMKRIPITEFLTEDQVINSVWEIEAILNTLYYCVVKDMHLVKMGKLVEVAE